MKTKLRNNLNDNYSELKGDFTDGISNPAIKKNYSSKNYLNSQNYVIGNFLKQKVLLNLKNYGDTHVSLIHGRIYDENLIDKQTFYIKQVLLFLFHIIVGIIIFLFIYLGPKFSFNLYILLYIFFIYQYVMYINRYLIRLRFMTTIGNYFITKDKKYIFYLKK